MARYEQVSALSVYLILNWISGSKFVNSFTHFWEY
jgi:hypothetical protein